MAGQQKCRRRPGRNVRNVGAPSVTSSSWRWCVTSDRTFAVHTAVGQGRGSNVPGPAAVATLHLHEIPELVGCQKSVPPANSACCPRGHGFWHPKASIREEMPSFAKTCDRCAFTSRMCGWRDEAEWSAFSTRCVMGIRLTCVERRVLDVVLGRVLVDERVDDVRTRRERVVDLHEGLPLVGERILREIASPGTRARRRRSNSWM